MDIDVELNNVVVADMDKTTILANATPSSSGTNIRAYASTKIVAFIGKYQLPRHIQRQHRREHQRRGKAD
jgi:hypothetical protein